MNKWDYLGRITSLFELDFFFKETSFPVILISKNADFMRCCRCHVVVIILVVAAIITPTSDVFTLLWVSFPMWLLYGVSILDCETLRLR